MTCVYFIFRFQEESKKGRKERQAWPLFVVKLLSQQKALIWFPAYAESRQRQYSLARFIYIKRSYKATALHNRLILSDTSHMNAVQDIWTYYGGFANKMTSGFYFLTNALSLCNDIHLYGYWPFTTDLDGKHVPYHYYDDMYLSKSHNSLLEWKYIVGLHHMGLSTVHVGSCTNNHNITIA